MFTAMLQPETSNWLEASKARTAVRLAYGWVEALRLSTERFWEVGYSLQLFSVKPDTQRPLTDEGPYFTVGCPLLEVKEPPPLLAKLSTPLSQQLLDNSLGQTERGRFELKQLTQLEQGILQQYGQTLTQSLKQHLEPELAFTEEEDWLTPAQTVITFLVASETTYLGSFLVQVPTGLLVYLADRKVSDKPGIAPVQETTVDQWLRHSSSVVKLCAGTTQLPLKLCRELEQDDMLILDQSHPDYLACIQPSGELKGFSVRYDKRTLEAIPPPEDEGPGKAKESFPMSKGGDFINQLNVEVKACFDPLKIPIEQLRQMGEGLVVEVGDLIQNKIQLEIEGNAIAEGELVIVGDKFGVLITKIPEEQANEQPQEMSLPAVAPAGGAPAKQQAAPQQNPIDGGLVEALKQQGLNVDELIQAARASGEDPNTYLAQVLEDHRGAQPVAAGNQKAANPAEDAMAEVDKMLSEDAG